MAKHITPISINNRVFKINTLHLEAIAHKHFNVTFNDADEKTKVSVKKYARDLVRDKERLSAQIIEDAIFMDFLSKNLQKDLKNLAYLQG